MPAVGPDDVLIQVMACGVCGTDVHIYEGDKGAAPCTPPTILGHEFSGVITQVGERVRTLTVGDRVCVDPNDVCGECDACKEGIAHYCRAMIGYGTTTNGGFAQYCAVRAKQAYRLADTTTFEEGAMAEPVACCLHGIDLCRIQPGTVALVIGGGMIGLLMLQLAKLCGAATLVLLEPVASKRALGAQLGADVCIDPLHEDVQSVLAAQGIHRIHTVIECVGNKHTMAQAVALAGHKAVVMLFGLTKPDDEMPLKPFEVFQKELEIKASFINPYTQQRAVDLINARKIDVSSMVCAPCGLEGLEAVLRDPALRRKGKYIIRP